MADERPTKSIESCHPDIFHWSHCVRREKLIGTEGSFAMPNRNVSEVALEMCAAPCFARDLD